MLSALFAEPSAQHVVVPVAHGFELGGGLSGNIQRERLLTVSFGGAHPARVDRALQLTWPQFAKWLVRSPAAADDKAAAGWYCPTEFAPEYRDSDNFVARHAITFDFDHVETDTWDHVLQTWHSTAFAIYTTYSHTEEKPRFRVVMPLSRPAGYDEFQAVARKVAEQVGIELIARESFVPAQMMYAPLRKSEDSPHRAMILPGEFLDVDAVLASYEDWTDVSSWPKRQEADGVHLASETQTPPTEKPGLIGLWCRTFDVPTAIVRFELPFVQAGH